MSTDNLFLTTKLRHKTIRTIWNIEDFPTVREALNASTINNPYLDSSIFGVGNDGPKFFLRFYSKGDKDDSVDYFSLFLKVSSKGSDKRWNVVDGGITKIRVYFEFALLDKKGKKFNKTGL